MKIKLIFLVFMVLLMGCATTQTEWVVKQTSPMVGCSPENIQIQDYEFNFLQSPTWKAMCNGKLFYCVYRDNSNTYCTEALDK